MKENINASLNEDTILMMEEISNLIEKKMMGLKLSRPKLIEYAMRSTLMTLKDEK